MSSHALARSRTISHDLPQLLFTATSVNALSIALFLGRGASFSSLLSASAAEGCGTGALVLASGAVFLTSITAAVARLLFRWSNHHGPVESRCRKRLYYANKEKRKAAWFQWKAQAYYDARTKHNANAAKRDAAAGRCRKRLLNGRPPRPKPACAAGAPAASAVGGGAEGGGAMPRSCGDRSADVNITSVVACNELRDLERDLELRDLERDLEEEDAYDAPSSALPAAGRRGGVGGGSGGMGRWARLLGLSDASGPPTQLPGQSPGHNSPGRWRHRFVQVRGRPLHDLPWPSSTDLPRASMAFFH